MPKPQSLPKRTAKENPSAPYAYGRTLSMANRNHVDASALNPRSALLPYSYRSATIGSTRAALLAGIQHATTPVASNNKTVLAKVAGS